MTAEDGPFGVAALSFGNRRAMLRETLRRLPEELRQKRSAALSAVKAVHIADQVAGLARRALSPIRKALPAANPPLLNLVEDKGDDEGRAANEDCAEDLKVFFVHAPLVAAALRELRLNKNGAQEGPLFTNRELATLNVVRCVV